MNPKATSKGQILGLGTDIIEIERVALALQEHPERFLQRLLTPQEIAYCKKHKDRVPHVAGRFCAKEALAKALGTGFGAKLSWLDLEILPDSLGKPQVTLSAALAERLLSSSFLVTISHCKLYATATALWLG